MVNKSSRDKEMERESVEKKHRKTSSTTNSNLNDILQPTKVFKEDIYASVIHFEEEESKKRSADKDAALFLQTCGKLKKIFAEIAHLKTQNSDKSQEEIKAKRIKGSFLFAILKKLSRLDKVRLRAGRDALHKEKLTVDSNKLQLQNLLYEADHLRKEVQHCLQFKSQDEEIDLVDEAKFYQEAPETISRRDKTETDEHVRRLARLEWELHQRKELSIMCKDLQMAKESVALEIESKTSRLDSLMPCLDQLLKSTRPLQEALGINVEKEWAVQQVASLLPRPLYVAYVNLSAYAEISGKLIQTCIVGDEEEAKELENMDKIACANETEEASQDSDYDDNDPENEGLSKKHHHRRQSSMAATEVNVFKPHPLSVTFKLPSTSNGASLSVMLYYLPALRFVTVQTKWDDFEIVGIAARDVLDPNNILNCLMSKESDENEILHPKTAYTLHHLSLEPSTFVLKLGEQRLGKPYTWAQNLCGLNFITCTKSSSAVMNYALTQESVPAIIDKMHNRLRSRLLLYRQILALENKNFFDLLTSPTPSAAIVAKITCNLAHWTSITWAEYVERSTLTNKFLDENIVTTNHLLYSAAINRASAKLECVISVSPNFPNECPIWAISLTCDNEKHNSSNNYDLKEMEFWINSIGSIRKNSANILVLQLERAMCAFDVYLETEMVRSPKLANEIKAEKTFLKIFRGRTRSRPYKNIQNSGSVIYTQIQ